MKNKIMAAFAVFVIAAGCSVNNLLNKSIAMTQSQSVSTNGETIELPPDFDIRLDGIWVIGGTNDLGMISTLDRYNPYTDSWESNVTTMMAPVRNFAVAAYGTKIYIFGGIDSNNIATNLVQIYDVMSNAWTNGTNMPGPREGHGAVSLGGRIYIFGGSSNIFSGFASQAVYQFIPTATTNPWSASLGNLVSANTVMDFGYTVFDGEILYGGGRNTAGTVNNSVSAILPLTSIAQTGVGALKINRFGLCAASYSSPTEKYAFFIGGSTTNGTNQLPSLVSSANVCVYYPYSEQGFKIVRSGPVLVQSRAYAQACVKGSFVFVFGGMANNTIFLSSVERLNVDSLFSSAWTTRAPMPSARAAFGVVTMR